MILKYRIWCSKYDSLKGYRKFIVLWKSKADGKMDPWSLYFSCRKNGILYYSPDSETDGLPADLSEFIELPVELVDAVPREHSEMLRRLDSIAADAAAAAAAEPVGALVLSPWRPWSAWRPWRPVWLVSCSSRRLRYLCSRDRCSLCMMCLRSRSSRFWNTTNMMIYTYYVCVCV